MMNQIASQADSPPNRSKGLLICTTIYGLLYLVFIIISFIPSPDGSPVSGTVPFKPFDLEQICVKLLFVVFVVGYVALWKNEGVGGASFIMWWAAMWALEVFIVAKIKPEESGGGIDMGLPLFIIGLLYVVRWYKGRSVEVTTNR